MRRWFELSWSSKYVLLVEYDGTLYHGFQWQVDLPTVQDELEKAIGRVFGKASRVMAASRTDAGVHAMGQVVSFWTGSELDKMALVRALNHYLPEDIAVKASYRVSAEFNVRGSAVSREYCYRILSGTTRSPLSRRFSLFVPRPLNVELMNEACELLGGEQDYASFASSLDDGKTTIRNVHEAGVVRKGEFTVFRIVASSFLPHQVRSTVGLLLRLGRGMIGIRDFRDIMQARRVGLAGPVAPARGLCLMKVNYATPLGSEL